MQYSYYSAIKNKTLPLAAKWMKLKNISSKISLTGNVNTTGSPFFVGSKISKTNNKNACVYQYCYKYTL